MADVKQHVNSPFSKYTKIEMRKQPRNYLVWVVGLIMVTILSIFLLGR